VRVFEVLEHDDIDIAIERLIVDGEFRLDQRISSRGYFTVAISNGSLKLRSTKFVGLVPLNGEVAVRIKPKATIANISQMMVRAGNIPNVIEDFSRGYQPLFHLSKNTIELYYSSFLASVGRMVRRGLIKHYAEVKNPSKWRGRLLISETVKRYAARGIRYSGVFNVTTLSGDVPENKLIKLALADVLAWLSDSPKPHQKRLAEAQQLYRAFSDVSGFCGQQRHLIAAIPRLAKFLPRHMEHYREPMWTAYTILQRSMPDVVQDGYASLDSMIIDISSVFENYVRRVIEEKAYQLKFKVRDGNIHQRRFFRQGDEIYKVKPDIWIEEGGFTKAILDVKYKPSIKEQDRYEVLAFMEATGATHAAFICPKMSEAEPSKFLGTTPGGRSMAVIRIDLAAEDLQAEEEKMFAAVLEVIEGRYSF
jgi:5-methylcytosine-specific restriction enzyme subunit McrC